MSSITVSPYRFSYSPQYHPTVSSEKLDDPENEAVIFLKGEIRTTEDIRMKSIEKCYIVAVDSGLINCCKNLKIIPDMIVVDETVDEKTIIDCLGKPLPTSRKEIQGELAIIEEFEHSQKSIKVHRLNHDKLLTNAEYAIQYILRNDMNRKQKIEKINFIGALGTSPDHQLRLYFLAIRYAGKVFLETTDCLMFGINHSTTCTVRSLINRQKISLYPVCQTAKGIKTEGLRWEIPKGELNLDVVSQSNQAMAEQIKISVAEGSLLVIVHKKPPEAALMK